jgi:spermidine/putrescine transport system permease protein
MFHDRRLLQGLGNSFYIGIIVSVLSVAFGTSNAFLFERATSRQEGFSTS